MTTTTTKTLKVHTSESGRMRLIEREGAKRSPQYGQTERALYCTVEVDGEEIGALRHRMYQPPSSDWENYDGSLTQWLARHDLPGSPTSIDGWLARLDAPFHPPLQERSKDETPYEAVMIMVAARQALLAIASVTGRSYRDILDSAIEAGIDHLEREAGMQPGGATSAASYVIREGFPDGRDDSGVVLRWTTDPWPEPIAAASAEAALRQAAKALHPHDYNAASDDVIILTASLPNGDGELVEQQRQAYRFNAERGVTAC